MNSDRYFSLRKVVSDVANNKLVIYVFKEENFQDSRRIINNNNICYRVVTGVRFKKVNQIIHIQIQQGELMPRGNIDKASVHWKSIEEFNVLDSNIKNGIDYHTLSWEKRGLDLDDLILDKNYLLTGTFK